MADKAMFLSGDWLQAAITKLNADEEYNRIARKWESDLYFYVETDERLSKPVIIYMDLWHGKCREAVIVDDPSLKKPVFVLKASYENFRRILAGELDPMQAMLTRKLNVAGPMTVMLKNVPVVLCFVRCLKEINTEFRSPNATGFKS